MEEDGSEDDEDYDERRVDNLFDKFEKRIERMNANLESKVKRNAAEKDVLKCAGSVRDLLAVASAGEKTKLEEVFGGSCRRFHRYNRVMEGIEFSTANQTDERWQDVRDQISTIAALLTELGSFRPWVQTTAPTDIQYGDNGEGFPEWLGDDIELEFVPIVQGTEPDTIIYRISPRLPEGMHLDRDTGAIKGKPAEDLEVPVTTYTITAENAAGIFEQYVTFGVKPSEPKSLHYDIDDIVSVGTHFLWVPESTGGRIREYTIEPELPKGLTLDSASGIISGTPFTQTEAQTFTVTGTNNSGSVQCSFEFGVTPAPPVAIKYNDVHGSDFNIGVSLYVMPEVEIESYAKNRALDHTESAAIAEANMRQSQSILSRVSYMSQTQSILSRVSYTSALPSWGRRFSESGAFQGTRWTRARNPLWETQVVSGMQPDITFVVSPELPAGLSISKTTGVISGRPTEKTMRRIYKVTASNESGSCSTNLHFGIVEVPPKGLEYPDMASIVYVGLPVTITPEIDGAVATWSIKPLPLPPGMTFDEQLGIISGVLERPFPRQEFMIVAKNDAGQAETAISLAGQRQVPNQLVYTPLRLGYAWEIDLKLTPQCLCDKGEPASVDRYSVEPELPTGLALDTSTGIISGRPTEVTPEAMYIVRAENESGSCEASITFTIQEMPPVELSYPGIDDYYGVGDQVNEVAVVQGGATSWSIEPELPKGLELDPSTGEIRGVPEEITEELSYTVTAENNAGGTSVVIEFEIAAPPPTKLKYPDLASSLKVGASVLADPVVIPTALGARYKVEPPLPTGLDLNEADGRITGKPEEPVDFATYVVTATNRVGSTTCNLKFECLEPPDSPLVVDQFFAAALEEVTDLSKMPEEPPKDVRMADWMLWMVHRAWLNDPMLTMLDFSNMQMPIPLDEPRIAPKLMKSMATNSHITSLLLPNSNVRTPQAFSLAESLLLNRTIQVINIEMNMIDPDGLQAVASALRDNPDVPLNTLRIGSQIRGDTYGRQVEEAVAQMLEKNDSITKVSFLALDPHWNNQISDKLLRNCERERRRRKQAMGISEEKVKPAVPKPLTKVVLLTPPDKAVWEIFEDDNAHFRLLRSYMSGYQRMPTRDQLQAFAKTKGEKLKYGQVAPLLKQFRAEVFKNMVGQRVTCHDDLRNSYTGKLLAVKEKNERINLDVLDSSGHWDFGADKQPSIEASKAMAAWLAVEEDAE